VIDKPSLFSLKGSCMTTATSAVEVEELVKRYPKAQRDAVDKVSFTVRRGEIFGLLGPNGAGKTTTIGILTTSILPSGGQARIMGLDVAADPLSVKQHIAVVPQRSNLDQSLRVKEILTYHAAYHGVPRPEREAMVQNWKICVYPILALRMSLFI
jgi:ABC-2 type transport system ATP-binding protein